MCVLVWVFLCVCMHVNVCVLACVHMKEEQMGRMCNWES